MKKLLLLSTLAIFTTFLFSSCSRDDGDNKNSSNILNKGTVNPPKWLQGTWGENYDDELVATLKVKPHNILIGGIASPFISITTPGVSFKEQISSTEYILTVSVSAYGSNIVENTYQFRKIGVNRIKFSIGGVVSNELDKIK